MKRFNLFDMYNFGSRLAIISNIRGDATMNEHWYNLWMARQSLDEIFSPESLMLGSSRRAAQKVIDAITKVIPRNWLANQSAPTNESLGEHDAWLIRSSIHELETVLRNEMPDVAAYVVAQKGIYRTEDLIANADKQVAISLIPAMPHQAISDLREAGKCLAFELGTACAFHLWRSVEAVIGLHYYQLTGKTFKDAGVQRNWGAYIRALTGSGADTKITALLNHIKNEFRNPQTHPEATVSIEEAQRLFSVAISIIEQMLSTGYSLLADRSKAAGHAPPSPSSFQARTTSELLGITQADD